MYFYLNNDIMDYMQYYAFLVPKIKVLQRALKIKWKILKIILKTNVIPMVTSQCRNDVMKIFLFDKLMFWSRIWVFSTGKHWALACVKYNFLVWCVHNLWTKTYVKIVFEQTCALPIAKYKERKNDKCVQNCEN